MSVSPTQIMNENLCNYSKIITADEKHFLLAQDEMKLPVTGTTVSVPVTMNIFYDKSSGVTFKTFET